VLPAAAFVHFQMLPKADRDQVYMYLDLPVDANLAYTLDVTKSIEGAIIENPNVINVQSYVGEPSIIDFNGMFKGAQGRDGNHQSTIRVNFKPAAERSDSSSDLAIALRDAVTGRSPDLAQYVRIMEEPPGPPVRATFVAKISAEDQSVQERVAGKLYTAIDSVTGITDRYIGIDAPVARTQYSFDHEAARERGVSMSEVDKVLSLLAESQTVSEYRASDSVEQTAIVLALPSSDRDAPVDINTLMVGTAAGEIVPLTTVLTTETASRPSAVTLEGATPTTFVTAEVSDRSIIYVIIDTMRMLARDEVSGLTMTDWNLFSMTLIDVESDEVVTIAWGGEWEMTLENFRDLGIAMMVALLLVYGVLVAQYNRFSTPAYILVTVPLGLVGILWGFFILDVTASIYLTATALIGFIALIGLVVNNAIIFLEYVEQELRLGQPFDKALLNAGQARLRPILLTSLTTILASLTIASDPVWSGLAWAIVFGLSLSTTLTLVIYPTLLMYYTGDNYKNNY
jgi:multidrug efflux pump subunit AcrB